jgi:hypothetical protein
MWVRFGCQGFPLQSCVLGLVLVRVPLLLKSWLCSRNVMMVRIMLTVCLHCRTVS